MDRNHDRKDVGPFRLHFYLTPAYAAEVVEGIHEDGFSCDSCPYERHIETGERLSGRATAVLKERECILLVSSLGDPGDCPALDTTVAEIVQQSFEELDGIIVLTPEQDDSA